MSDQRLRTRSSAPTPRIFATRPTLAFAYGVPVGALGGLIGLGGGELRLPILIKLFGVSARRAVPLNSVVTLFTLAGALIIRSRGLSIVSIEPYGPAMVGLSLDGALSAASAVAVFGRLQSGLLERTIQCLLGLIGVLLVAEALGMEMMPPMPPPQGYVAVATVSPSVS